MEQKAERPRRAAAVLVAAALLILSAVVLWPVSGGQEEHSTPAAAPAVLELVRKESKKTTAGKVGSTVIPLGRTVGIKLFSDGVLVVGLSDIQTRGTTVSPAKDMGLKVGDVITHVNDCEVDTIEQMQSAIQTLAGQTMTLKVMRQDKQLQLCGAAVCSQQGTYQLGTWIRDSTQILVTLGYRGGNACGIAVKGCDVKHVKSVFVESRALYSVAPEGQRTYARARTEIYRPYLRIRGVFYSVYLVSAEQLHRDLV